MSISLHIERLVIDEAVLGGESPAAMGVAMTRELQRLLAHSSAVDILAGIGAVTSLPPGGLQPSTTVEGRLGPRLAQAVHQVLGIPSPMASSRGAPR